MLYLKLMLPVSAITAYSGAANYRWYLRIHQVITALTSDIVTDWPQLSIESCDHEDTIFQINDSFRNI
jgi:hypothetical protein